MLTTPVSFVALGSHHFCTTILYVYLEVKKVKFPSNGAQLLVTTWICLFSWQPYGNSLPQLPSGVDLVALIFCAL